jgi:hypothetical protein
VGKANHVEPIQTGGTTHITTRTPAENKASYLDEYGRGTGIRMAANLELTGRTPRIFVAASNLVLAPARKTGRTRTRLECRR